MHLLKIVTLNMTVNMANIQTGKYRDNYDAVELLRDVPSPELFLPSLRFRHGISSQPI